MDNASEKAADDGLAEAADEALAGGCLCGAVRYALSEPLRFARNCHCEYCRKHSGAAFLTFAYVPVATFRWIQGEEHVQRYESSSWAARTFCRLCGSTLQFVSNQHPEAFGLALGTVEGDPGCRPARHICLRSKALWYEIGDALPRHDWLPPED